MLKPAFQAACRTAVEQLARETAAPGPALVVGTPWLDDGKLYNAAALLDGGAIAALRYKVDLPNYGVFDEKRVFVPGPLPGPVNFRGVRLGLPVCEDIWGPEPVECIAETGGEILLVLNGSPYPARRRRRAAQRHRAARQGDRPAADLRQPGRRPGRAGVRRRLARAQRATARWRSSCDSYKEAVVTTQWQRAGPRLALRRRAEDRGARRRSRPTTRPACWACATTSTRTAFPASCSACRAASIPRCARRWRSMRWAPSASAAS